MIHVAEKDDVTAIQRQIDALKEYLGVIFEVETLPVGFKLKAIKVSIGSSFDLV